MASRQGSSSAKGAATAEAAEQQQQQGDGEFDPVYEWLDADANYLLRLNLPGFKKEDFQVFVDPAGRLTVRGHRGSLRLHKVFQLPPTCNLDGITGRLDGSVLVLTVPKQLTSAAAAPPPKAKEEEEAKKADEHVAGKPTDHKASVGREAERRIEAARERLARRHGEKKDHEEEPNAAAAAAARPRRETAEREHHDAEKARAEHKARLAREAERRIEAARLPPPPPSPEKKAPCWKERAVEEGLKLAEAMGKHKEVIATAVAAFTIGVFVSHKLFARSN